MRTTEVAFPIHILARLPDATLELVRRNVPSGWHIVEAEPDARLVDLARTGPYDVVMLDVRDRVLGDGPTDRLVAGATDLWGCGPPLVLCVAAGDYAALDRVRVLDERLLHCEVIIAPGADDDQEVQKRVRSAALSRTSAHCVHALLSNRNALLRRELAWLVSDLFRHPAKYRTTNNLLRVDTVSMTIQQVNEGLAAAGLRSFGCLRKASRVASASDLLARGSTVARVALKLGCSDETLRRNVEESLGLPPEALRRRTERTEIVRNLCDYCSRVGSSPAVTATSSR